ncbi:MAG TPA: ABC transporter permease/substrate-binding protein [Pseudogracilibacillus sp.]|nr:ABC transporter permease/substrate-binding protein [Pseudogracilibacillus sp.]
MANFISTYQNRIDEFWYAAWEHLQISLISLAIAILLAIPLALWLTRRQKIAEPIIGASAVLQTIPSLAVLAFLIPFFGIGKVPAVIALFLYGLLPIMRNTYTGVKEVSAPLKEAAMGMGMSSFKRLTKVELPIAMPTIMAGIRTSMVLIVGTTTIAALIGAGGLGKLILLGIDRGADINLILLGAIPAALLAIALDYILRLFEYFSLKSGFKSLIVMLVLVILVIFAPFLFKGGEQEEITIGGKLNAEPEILINMYKLLIEDETDINVNLEPELGKTAFVFEALKNKSIDIYPEFTGTAIVTFMEEEADSNKEEEVYEQARDGMKEQFDMEYLKPMKYNNTYTVSVKEEFAEENDLETMGDLKEVEDDAVAGFTLEFNDRQDGYQGMKDVYDLDLEVQTMDPGLRQEAIKSDEVQMIDAYATDSYMIDLGLVSLDDPEDLFPPYQGAPLMREETLDEYPELEEILNQLAGKISDKEMREMNYEVDFEDQPPREVAKDFLENEGLLERE